MPNTFSTFSEIMERINNTSSRLEIQSILSQYYLSLIDNDLTYAVYLSTATFYPEYKNKQLNIGDKIIMDVLKECTGRKLVFIKKEYSKEGDYGVIGMKYRTPQLFISKKKLNIKEVVMKIREIAELTGPKSKESKIRRMLEMVSICSPLETKYIFRLFEEKLKVKISFSTVLISLGKMLILREGDNTDGCNKSESIEDDDRIKDGGSKMKVLIEELDGNKEEDDCNNNTESTNNNLDHISTTNNNLDHISTTNNNLDHISTTNNHLNDSFIDEIKSAYHRKPDLEELINVLLEKGIHNLKDTFTISPGIPLKPMLATPAKDVSSAYKKVENRNFTCEYKYDGERVQIHCTGGKMSIYSRNLEDNTEKYKDIIVGICNGNSNESDKKDLTHLPNLTNNDNNQHLHNNNNNLHSNNNQHLHSNNNNIHSNNNNIHNNCVDYILDGEVVAYDKVNKKILSFQELSTRKRKDIDINKITVHVCMFVFDLLYFNESLINKPLETRRKILHQEFREIENKFYFSEYVDCTNTEEIDDFFKKACDGNYEGIMIKQLDDGSNYMPSQRSNSWIKLKKDYLNALGDSFDLVVIGAYYGKGKRAGTYGGFLLASYNDKEGVYESICKIGTGFSEETLSVIYKEINCMANVSSIKDCDMSSIKDCDMSSIMSSNKVSIMDGNNDNVNNNSSLISNNYHHNIRIKDQIKPDVWVRPKLVWEVKAAGVSLSPAYSCGITKGKGLSLRFPRFIRSREDKKPEDATTSDEIYAMYKDV